MKHVMLVVVLLGMLVMPLMARAQSYDIWCSGTIAKVLAENDGSVLFQSSWRGDWLEACSLKGTWNNIGPLTCSVWYSLLVTAYSGQKQTTMEYSSPYSACADIPTYGNAAPPAYVMVN